MLNEERMVSLHFFAICADGVGGQVGPLGMKANGLIPVFEAPNT